jgi:large-conductance mechanosensitive channel
VQVPGPRHLPARSAPEVTVSVKKIIAWVLVAFVVFYVIKFPNQSAEFVRSVGDALSTAASQLATFIGNLG